MNNLHVIVREQFPEFVRTDYPVFVEFVKAYYKWLDEQGVGKLEGVLDIENTPDQFVQYFRRQLDIHGLLNNVVPFNKLYLTRIKQIYDRRGSEECLINLLKLATDTNVTVRYPVENILRASAGDWVQDHFITVERTFGTLPSSINEFYLKEDSFEYRIQATRHEIVGPNLLRIYHRPHANEIQTLGQIILLYSGNTIVWAGRVVSSPSYLEIRDGGKNWQLGQIIRFPASEKDTIARVSQVSGEGAIERIEILEYGFPHTEGETIISSPYPYKPLGTVYDLTYEITSVDPISYSYTLTLNDYTDGSTEHVVGIMAGVNYGSYFLENYVERSYAGEVVLDQQSISIETETYPNPDITIEDWLASRATIALRFTPETKMTGKWASQRNHISNQDIRLQDNYYYQQFSYDVEAETSNSQYMNITKLVHPAGMKLFTTYSIIDDISITPTAETTFPFLKVDLLDVVETDDDRAKNIGKSLFDTTNPASDDITQFRVNKYLSDSATVVSDDTYSTGLVIYNEDTEAYFAEDYAQVETILNIGV